MPPRRPKRAPELLLALREKSYELIKVHEVHQYPGTVAYNPETGEDGLLSGYVRCFMALKMQASGWPPECDSDDKKEQFIKDTLKRDGVVLDPAKMVKNSALRTMAKLMCNSFWGKFGEKTLRSRTDLIYDPAKLKPLLTDPRKEVTGLLPLSEECIQVTWKPVEDSETSLPTFHYMLWEAPALQVFGCVWPTSAGLESQISPSAHIWGDLTDQVEEDYGPGSFITEFVAGGPKNYAYKVAVGGDPTNIKVCIKVRGISINKSCDDLITFDNLKAMVMGNTKRLTVPIPHQIARLPGWKIVTRSTRKIWQAVNTKRRRVCVEHTVPFGYNAWTMAPEEDQDLLEVMDLLADA
ncbi:DNA polymerase [Frankliniella fusca]|uniref:DNA polymerase n=1 Tax=Frankliniella fusca TaxID=407009 RepID=A0AAE1HVX1_9NEOP|nr:DNA polymerase [Frankliniella fusca]